MTTLTESQRDPARGSVEFWAALTPDAPALAERFSDTLLTRNIGEPRKSPMGVRATASATGQGLLFA